MGLNEINSNIQIQNQENTSQTGGLQATSRKGSEIAGRTQNLADKSVEGRIRSVSSRISSTAQEASSSIKHFFSTQISPRIRAIGLQLVAAFSGLSIIHKEAAQPKPLESSKPAPPPEPSIRPKAKVEILDDSREFTIEDQPDIPADVDVYYGTQVRDKADEEFSLAGEGMVDGTISHDERTVTYEDVGHSPSELKAGGRSELFESHIQRLKEEDKIPSDLLLQATQKSFEESGQLHEFDDLLKPTEEEDSYISTTLSSPGAPNIDDTFKKALLNETIRANFAVDSETQKRAENRVIELIRKSFLPHTDQGESRAELLNKLLDSDAFTQLKSTDHLGPKERSATSGGDLGARLETHLTALLAPPPK